MGFSSSQMATAAMVSQIGGAVGGAVGSYYGANAQKNALEGQAELAKINARIAELGAQSVLAQGQQQIGALTLKAGQVKSSQRASLAANGVDLGVGSAAELQASTDIIKDIDKNTLEANAVRSAWGYRTQTVNMQNDALMRQTAADGISPSASVASSLLGGASGVAGTWYSLNKTGALKGTVFGLG